MTNNILSSVKWRQQHLAHGMLHEQSKFSKCILYYHQQSHHHLHLHDSSLRPSYHIALVPKSSCLYITYSITSSPDPLFSSGFQLCSRTLHSDKPSLQQATTTSLFQCHIVSEKVASVMSCLWTRLIIQSYISCISVLMFPYFTGSNLFKVTSDTVY